MLGHRRWWMVAGAAVILVGVGLRAVLTAPPQHVAPWMPMGPDGQLIDPTHERARAVIEAELSTATRRLSSDERMDMHLGWIQLDGVTATAGQPTRPHPDGTAKATDTQAFYTTPDATDAQIEAVIAVLEADLHVLSVRRTR